jgi:hypothetical protein
MTSDVMVAVAEYQTPFNGREYPCVGAILMASDERFVLREHITLGLDNYLRRDIFHQRTRIMPLTEAKQVLSDWVELAIAAVVQIPWERGDAGSAQE